MSYKWVLIKEMLIHIVSLGDLHFVKKKKREDESRHQCFLCLHASLEDGNNRGRRSLVHEDEDEYSRRNSNHVQKVLLIERYHLASNTWSPIPFQSVWMIQSIPYHRRMNEWMNEWVVLLIITWYISFDINLLESSRNLLFSSFPIMIASRIRNNRDCKNPSPSPSIILYMWEKGWSKSMRKIQSWLHPVHPWKHKFRISGDKR